MCTVVVKSGNDVSVGINVLTLAYANCVNCYYSLYLSQEYIQANLLTTLIAVCVCINNVCC